MPFLSRTDAGRRLAEVLVKYRGQPVVVFALPRGGVPVAAEIAEALNAPLDLLFVRKIGVPFHAELAMGAVADGGATVRNDDIIKMLGVSAQTFDAVREQELAEIERRRRAYVTELPGANLSRRVAIVVDDGVATGATTKAALRAVRARGPARLVLAVPVAPQESLLELKREADEVVVLEPLGALGAIGAHYLDFRQLTDDEVVATLKRLVRPEGRSRA